MTKYTKISKNIHKLEIDNPDTPDKKLVWINIKNARKKEIEYLRKNYKFNLSYLQASSAKSISQRPMVIKDDDYLFMILHFPVLDNNNVVPGEIEFFIGKNYLITLHNDNVKALNEFFNFCKKDSCSLLAYNNESSAMLLYELLDKLIQDTFYLLDQNSIAISEVEEMIFSDKQKEAVSRILSVRRNFINIRRIMQSHKNIIKKLLSIQTTLTTNEQVGNYYRKLIEYTKNIWEILENQKEMIEALNNTNESMLNYRISNIMKTLTIFSVIVFPLTLFAAIFGMNTMGGMPFIDNKYGFWIIIFFMSIGCLFMLLFFKKKKWL